MQKPPSVQTTQHHLKDCWVAKSRDTGDVWWETVGALLPLTSISDCLFFTRTTVRGCLQILMPLWFGDYPASPFNVLLSLDLSSIPTFSLHLWQLLLSYLRDLQQWQFFISDEHLRKNVNRNQKIQLILNSHWFLSSSLLMSMTLNYILSFKSLGSVICYE